MERMGFNDPDRSTESRKALHDKIQTELISGPAEFAKYYIDAEPGTEISDEDFRVTIEYPLADGKYTLGFLDAVIRITNKSLSFIGGRTAIAVEIKTRVDSVGELIRELRYYQQYWRDPGTGKAGALVVLCPDGEFREIVIKQGFGFVTYTGMVGAS